MDVVIAGAHGQIARRLTRLLAARDDAVRGLVRNPDHLGDITADGGEGVVCDLERGSPEEVAATLSGADAVVFAAGAGPGSSADRKSTMDRDGALLLLDAARAADVPRYVMVSAVGAESAPEGDDVFSVYLRAKRDADLRLAESDRRWTIVRPGRLTDEPGTGRVRLDEEPHRGEVPRDDVAAVLAAVLARDDVDGRTLYVNGGEEDIDDALAAAAGASP